jgi:hypothetical protein
LKDLIHGCDFIIEAVKSDETRSIIRQALLAKKKEPHGCHK